MILLAFQSYFQLFLFFSSIIVTFLSIQIRTPFFYLKISYVYLSYYLIIYYLTIFFLSFAP